jgi:hypothetical protein
MANAMLAAMIANPMRSKLYNAIVLISLDSGSNSGIFPPFSAKKRTLFWRRSSAENGYFSMNEFNCNN